MRIYKSMKYFKYVIVTVCVLSLAVVGFSWLLYRADINRFRKAETIRQLLVYTNSGLYENACFNDYVARNPSYRNFIEEFSEALAAGPAERESVVGANADNDMLLPAIAALSLDSDFQDIDSLVNLLREYGVNIFDERCFGGGELVYNAIATGRPDWLRPLLVNYADLVDQQYHFIEYAIDECENESMNLLLEIGYAPDYELYRSNSVDFVDFVRYECPSAYDEIRGLGAEV